MAFVFLVKGIPRIRYDPELRHLPLLTFPSPISFWEKELTHWEQLLRKIQALVMLKYEGRRLPSIVCAVLFLRQAPNYAWTDRKAMSIHILKRWSLATPVYHPLLQNMLYSNTIFLCSRAFETCIYIFWNLCTVAFLPLLLPCCLRNTFVSSLQKWKSHYLKKMDTVLLNRLHKCMVSLCVIMHLNIYANSRIFMRICFCACVLNMLEFMFCTAE